MNLSKEIKQKIAFNYMLNKMGDINSKYREIHNKRFFEVRNRIFEIKELNENYLQNFYDKVSVLNPKFKELISNKTNNQSYCYNDSVMVDNYDNKVIFHNIHDKMYSKEGFDFQIEAFPLSCINGYSKIEEDDKIFKDILIQSLNEEKELLKECQTHYDNLYELIRNIRTLDRIRKNFPDVDDYLPEDFIKTKEKEKEISIKEKFEKL